jgi:hypothetical protein
MLIGSGARMPDAFRHIFDVSPQAAQWTPLDYTYDTILTHFSLPFIVLLTKFIGPTYQAGSFFRAALIVQAYMTRDPMDYHDALMPLHGFVYTRALLFMFGIMGPSIVFKGNINFSEAYSLAVFGAAVTAVSHCSSPWAPPMYMATVFFIGVLSRWNSKM